MTSRDLARPAAGIPQRQLWGAKFCGPPDSWL